MLTSGCVTSPLLQSIISARWRTINPVTGAHAIFVASYWKRAKEAVLIGRVHIARMLWSYLQSGIHYINILCHIADRYLCYTDEYDSKWLLWVENGPAKLNKLWRK